VPASRSKSSNDRLTLQKISPRQRIIAAWRKTHRETHTTPSLVFSSFFGVQARAITTIQTACKFYLFLNQ
jgi:hypothetical protein